MKNEAKPAKFKEERVFSYERAQYKHPYTIGPVLIGHTENQVEVLCICINGKTKKHGKREESRPKTGPRPASSMPMMQGSEVHWWIAAPDPIPQPR